MKTIGFVIGGGALVAIIAVAAKASASGSSSADSSSAPRKTPTKTVPKSTPKMEPNGFTGYLGSVPATIVARVIELEKSDRDLAQSQAVWLRDNGWPLTSDAVIGYLTGDLSQDDLRRVASDEVASKLPRKASAKGTTTADPYGDWVLENGSSDQIYSYASTSSSINTVTKAAAKLAAAGDLRAAELTQHLADLR